MYRTREEWYDRAYLNKMYAARFDRHGAAGGDEEGEGTHRELEAEMFAESMDEDEERSDGGSSLRPRLAELPADAQEKVLLDEVIGAMMGQEGQFVRYQLLSDAEEMDDSRGEE